MSDWYEDNIEEPLRGLVKLLRNSGFNTECSCGHDMYVQIAHFDGGVEELDHFLFLHSLRDYVIELQLTREEGHLRKTMDLKLPKSFTGIDS